MKKIFPLSLILILSIFSVVAFITGLNLSDENPTKSITAYKELENNANNGKNIDTLLSEQTIPAKILFTIYYKLSNSAKYAFGKGSYLIAYQRHSKRMGVEKVSLYVHILLGSLILLIGGFQFWPWFRQKYTKIHRILGVLYIVAVIFMGIAIFLYLINAGIYNTHEEFVGYWGLHLLNATTTIPIFFSLYYLFKQDFYRHMGWMALSFGSILTAPTQRFSWSIIASMKLDLTHEVANSIVDTYLFSTCYFIGYLLFCINRVELRKRQITQPKELSIFSRMFVLVISLLSVCTIFYHFYLTTGLYEFKSAQLVLSKEVITQEMLVIFSDTLLPNIFVVFYSLSILTTAVLFFKKSIANPLHYLVILSTSITILIELAWGVKMGLPKTVYSVGGSHYFFYGLSHLALLLLVIVGKLKYKNFYKEWVLGLWLLLLVIPLWYWFIYAHASFFNYIDPIFITKNHIHQFLVALAPSSLFISLIIVSLDFGYNDLKFGDKKHGSKVISVNV